jgi:hypothetical protein
VRVKRLAALALCALLASCGRGDGARENEAANGAIVPDSEIANVAAAPNGAEPMPEPPLDELAGVKVGTTVAQLRAAGFDAVKDAGPDPENSCGYARIAGLKDLFFMLDGDTVVRIDVASAGHPTLGGVAVGMSEAEALKRLGARAKVQPHPYTGPAGHYLVVHEEGAPFGLILETDGKTVESYRIGRWEQVQWKENCL